MNLKNILKIITAIQCLLLIESFVYIQQIYDVFDYSVTIATGVYKFSLFSGIVALIGCLVASKISKANAKIITLFVIAVTVISGAVFAVDSYKKYEDYVESTNGSHISSTYKTEDEIKEFLPYYDYFKGGKKASYSVSMFKSACCTNISIDNMPYLMINHPYYEAEFYETENLPVKLKVKREMLIDRTLSDTIELYKSETNENDVHYVVYENDSGYAIEMSRASSVAQITLANIDKEQLNLEDFIQTSINQFELLCELKNEETVPNFQHYYSE